MNKKRNIIIILSVAFLIMLGSYVGGAIKKDLALIVPIVPYFFM